MSFILSIVFVVISILSWGLLQKWMVPDVQTLDIEFTSMPIRRDGVVFVSDGSRGSVRDASIELTKLGYHVLLGVKSEEERRTFAFDQRKGLETILYDVADPVTLVTVVNRLRQIRRDLDRPIVGLVINLSDFIEDHVAEKEYVDVELLDINYKSLVKGPMRLIQSIFDSIRYKTIDDRDFVEGYVTDTGRMITANASTSISSARVKFDNIAPNSSINAMGLRIIAVTSDMSEVTDRIICGTKCVMQDTFVNFIDSFRSEDSTVSNISLSTIYSNFNTKILDDDEIFSLITNHKNTSKSSRYLTHPHYHRVKSKGPKAKKEEVYKKQLLVSRLRMIQQFIDDKLTRTKNKPIDVVSELNNIEDSKHINKDELSYTAKAILHAIASNRPQYHYDEKQLLNDQKS